MKKTALQQALKDGAEVAVGQYARRKGKPLPPAQPGRIVKLGCKRRSLAAGGWGNVTANDGVRVRPAQRGEKLRSGNVPATKWDWRGVAEDQERTTHRIVAPAHVLCTWSEYMKLLDEQQAEERAKSRVKEDAEAEAAKVNEYLGFDAAYAHFEAGLGSRLGHYTGSVVIPWQNLRRLRKRAEG